MGFFRRKPVLSIEEFCWQFFDSQVFQSIIGGTDIGSVFWKTAYDSIKEVDNSFAAIDPATFAWEMTALRVELFGLAWMHHFQLEEWILPEIVATKRYLEENGKLDTWDTMLHYNQAIARSQTEPRKKTPSRRRLPPLAAGDAVLEAHINFMNDLRTEMFGKWVEVGLDPDCAARVANRTSTDETWNDHPGIEMLATTLMERLGCQLNSEGCFRLKAVIFGLYDGARKAVRSVNSQLRQPGNA